jgi:membrane-associated phospholipid phosphatase
VAAGATNRFDASVTSGVSGNAMARNFRSGNIVGGAQFQFGTALAAYGIGRVSGNHRVSNVAGKVFRAQLMAQVLTGVAKQAAQRTRPDGADQRSFPSGHTSVSFASATVLQREFGWKVGIPAYAVAASVATARIEKKKHYLSDVAFGAAIGILSGRTVTIGSGEKRFAVAPAAVPGGAAVNFTWVGNDR